MNSIKRVFGQHGLYVLEMYIVYSPRVEELCAESVPEDRLPCPFTPYRNIGFFFHLDIVGFFF
jgi:hypothetical protein